MSNCTKKVEIVTSKEIPIDKWVTEYFDVKESVDLKEVSDFCEIAFGSIYQPEVRNILQFDTIDVISSHPTAFDENDLENYFNFLHSNLEKEIKEKADLFVGVIVIPLHINGKLYTRNIILSNKISIAERSFDCNHSGEYHFKNGSTCSNTEGHIEIQKKFNASCYFPYQFPLACSFGTVRSYSLAPSINGSITEDIPCDNFMDCFDLAQDDFNPSLCLPVSGDFNFCSLLETGNTSGPDYKLFRRDGDNTDVCMTASLRDEYQVLLSQLAQGVKNSNIPGVGHIDNSWRAHSVFLSFGGASNNTKHHKAILVYEKCIAKFKF